MSGTDPTVHEVTIDPAIARRKEIQRLRSLFIRPHKVFLVTMPTTSESLCEPDYDRWLSDNYVIVKVTGSSALMVPEDPELGPTGADWADGAYNLMASKGLTPRDAALIPDTAGLLRSLEGREEPVKWLPMKRTFWSMADSDAKLMLAWAHCDGVLFELAINEGVWQAFVDAFPGYPVNFQFYDDETPYRVVDDYGNVIGYVAHADFPKDMYEQSDVLVDWLVKHQ